MNRGETQTDPKTREKTGEATDAQSTFELTEKLKLGKG